MMHLAVFAAALFGAPALSYDAPPESCPDRDAFVAQVAQLAGLDVAAVENIEASFSVVIRPVAEGFAAELIEDGVSLRKLEGRDCQAVARAVALVTSLAIQPRLRPPPQVDPPPPPKPPRTPARPPPRPATSTTAVQKAGDFALGLGFGVDGGSLPGAGVVLTAEISFRFQTVRVGAGWLELFPRADLEDGRGARIALHAGWLRGCLGGSRRPPRAGDWWAGLCLATEIGFMSAVPVALQDGDPRNPFWWAVGFDGEIAYDLTGGLEIFWRIAPRMSLTQISFEIGGLGVVHEVRRFLFRSALGTRLVF